MVRVERRDPERHRHTRQLLGRLALGCLVLAVILLIAPRVLVEVGLLGPKPSEVVEGAARAVEAARVYGATPELPAFAAAQRELEEARRLVREGKGRPARQAAARASAHAIDAQRLALVRREETHRRAAVIVQELDRYVNDLEDLYAAVTPGLDKATVSALFTRMKEARQTAAIVFLAFDEKSFAKVLETEQAARRALADTRAALEAARR